MSSPTPPDKAKGFCMVTDAVDFSKEAARLGIHHVSVGKWALK
jgi:hypothetical protein